MTTALPTNISFGKVRGRFGSPILSAGDADGLPDFQPLSGLEVTFTPRPDTILNLGASPVPVTLLTEKIVCTLDADGYLVGPDGREGINLIATDDADLAPTGWTYTVSFGGSQATYKRLQTFDISVPSGSTRWLTAIGPIPSSSGQSTLDEVEAAILQMGVAVGQAQNHAQDAADSAAQAAASASAFSVDGLPQAGTVGKVSMKAATQAAGRAAINAVDITTGQLDKVVAKVGTWIDPAHPSYGADPTGATDSAPAWRLAVAAAQTTGNAIIPSPGTYLFTSKVTGQDIFIPLTKGIRIHARTLGDVTIKIANATKSWVSVFGTVMNSGIDLSGLDIRNMVFDGDSLNNIYPHATAPRRYLVSADRGTGLRFIHNRVVNWDARNVIHFNGSTGNMSVLRVTDNEFVELGGPVYHDSSTLYMLANDWKAIGNTFRGVDLGPNVPNNCIAPCDMHGSNYQFKNNYVENFASAGPICGPDPAPAGQPSSGYEITGNIFRSVGRGLAWFSMTLMDSGVIADNIIDIDMDRWPDVTPPSYNEMPGEVPKYGLDHAAFSRLGKPLPNLPGQPLTHWLIKNNYVSWRGAGGGNADMCYKIIGDANDIGDDIDFVSTGNVFVNPPSAYLYVYGFGTLRGWTFDDIVRNPCRGEFGTVYQSLYRFRNGTGLVNCHFGGTFTDDKTGAASSIKWWLLSDTGTDSGIANIVPTFTNVDLDGIRVTTAAVTPPSMMSGQPGQAVRCSTVVQNWVAPTGNAAFTAGSSITEMATGRTRTQTALPAGASFSTQIVHAPEVLRAIGGASTIAVTVDRANAPMSSTGIAALTSGTCYVGTIAIPRPSKPLTVSFITGTSPAASPTNRWAALTDSTGKVLAVTADATTTAVGAGAQFNMNFLAPVDIQPGLYAVHMMIAAGTMPTVLGLAQTTAITGRGTILCGPGATGQTTPPVVGSTLAMPTVAGTGPMFLQLT